MRVVGFLVSSVGPGKERVYKHQRQVVVEISIRTHDNSKYKNTIWHPTTSTACFNNRETSFIGVAGEGGLLWWLYNILIQPYLKKESIVTPTIMEKSGRTSWLEKQLISNLLCQIHYWFHYSNEHFSHISENNDTILYERSATK